MILFFSLTRVLPFQTDYLKDQYEDSNFVLPLSLVVSLPFHVIVDHDIQRQKEYVEY